MLELLEKGMTFDLDPPRWDDSKRTAIWVVVDLDPMFARIAPVDRTCIPPEITRRSLEGCMLTGIARPCSLVQS